MWWSGCQNNQINFNFNLQKSLEIFEKNSADKIWSTKNIKVKMPCPVPDRVKEEKILQNFLDFIQINSWIMILLYQPWYLLIFSFGRKSLQQEYIEQVPLAFNNFMNQSYKLVARGREALT